MWDNRAARPAIGSATAPAVGARLGNRLPNYGLLYILSYPNLSGKFSLPADTTIRTATGWVSGTVNLFYDAAGVPIAVTASEIAAWPSINQWNVLFHSVSADSGRLAVYAADTPIAVLNKALKILRETALDLTPTIFFNGLDTTGKTSYTGGPTYVQDNLGVIGTPAANYPAVEGMRLDGTTYKDTLIDGVTPIVPSVDQSTRTFDAGFTTSSAGPTFKDYTRPTPLTAPGWLCEPARTNKCTCRKANPVDTSNITFIGGATGAVVTETTGAIATATAASGSICDLSTICNTLKVYEFVLPAAGVAQFEGYTGNTNAHSSKCFSKVVSGGLNNVEFGLASSDRRIKITTTEYKEFRQENVIPILDTRRVIFYNSSDSQVIIRAILPQLEEGSFCTSTICKLADGSDPLTAITRAGTVLTYPTAGKLRSNNIALKLSVVPRGTGQSGYLWGAYTDASNFCYLSINPYDITFKSVIAGISKDVAIASYTHTKDVPFEVILCKSTQGSQLLVREYTGGAWQAWVRGGLSVTGDNLVLSTSYTLGSFNNTSQFTGNISEVDSLLIPSGIANPTAWVESQWDVNGAGSNPVIFNHTFTGLTLLDGVLQTKSATDSVTINWGDGTSNTYAGTADTAFTHTYASATTIYNVTYTASDSTVLTKIRYTDRAGGKVGGVLSLPASMTYFSCLGSNTLSGVLSLSAAMTTFHCTGSNTLSGILSLPASMTSFVCTGSNTLSGVLSLPASMTYFSCLGSNTLSGILSLPAAMTYFGCTGSNTLSGYTPSAKAINQQRFTLTGLNTLSAANVDAIIQDYANAGGTWGGEKTFSLTVLTASNRTAASDAAWTTLGTKGLVTRTITLR